MNEHTLRTQNLEKKLLSISKHIYKKLNSFDPILRHSGELPGAEQPQFDDSTWDHFSVGQSWGGRDVICWFRMPFQAPKDMPKGKLAAIIQPGKKFYFKAAEGGDLREYELLIYLDGQPLQSVDVRRNEIPLWDKVLPGETHLLAIEAFSGLETHRHQFKQAGLVLINEEVEDFYYNVKMALDTMNAIGIEHPDNSRLFAVLEKALLRVDFLSEGEPLFYESIADANTYLRSELYASLPSQNDRPSIVSIGHAHLDIAWMWQTKHSKRKAVRTCANAVRLMDLYPDYHFLQSQALLYKYIEELHPSLFARMKDKIANGQWEVTGGMWVEPDCNLPNGESLVRQFLFGKRYFQQKFGVDVQVVWLPDGFGFCYSLPQIIKKSGMNYFMTTKLSWSQFTKIPYDTFLWQGLDGTKILTHMITTPDERGWNDYSVDLNPVNIKNCWDNYHQKTENREVLISFGWGDGGGGPTREMQENAKRLPHFTSLPSHHQGQAEIFFADLEKQSQKMPVWNDELYLQFHRGCYTSQAGIKRNNRQSEVLLHNAEFLSAWNFLSGGSYPQEALNRAWEILLLNQFHDILPGSSIPEVYRDSEKEFEQIKTIAHHLIDEAMAKLCTSPMPQGNLQFVFAINSLSWKRRGLIHYPLAVTPQYFEIRDDEGKNIPFQEMENDEILLRANDVSPLGYKVYEIRESNSPIAHSCGITVTPRNIQNRFFDIQLNEDGFITAIYDIENQRDIIPDGSYANVMQVFEDRPLRNNAWDIDIFYQDKCVQITSLEEITVLEEGPIRAALLLKRKYLQSTIKQIIYVYDEIPRIDFKTEIEWQQHQTLLKVAFPVSIHAKHATYEIPYGNIERPTHWNTDWDKGKFEVPAQKWADLSEGDYGVSLLNDCKYGYDIKDNVIRLTLIKSAIDPDPNADIGHHEFCYSLFPH
ncbi:MAG: alpha-mannosidase, partial [Actinobacteria bacterium]|nr:alpha-mannosidase [Actinomycetota bacterium]